MLHEWLQDQYNGQIPSGLLLIGFVAEEAEKTALEALIQSAGEALPAVRFIWIPQEKKLAAACEVSRTPTLLFTIDGMETARIYRPRSTGQIKAALAGVRVALSTFSE